MAGLALVGVVTALIAVGARPAWAHTSLLQGSPGPGDRVGGVVDFVDLAFLEPVTEAEITVLLDGEVLAGTTTVAEGRIIRFELDEPITEPARYDVTWDMISFDGDATVDGYAFVYDPSAPAARRIGTPPTAGTGAGPGVVPAFEWGRLAAAAVLVVCLAGLVFVALTWIDDRRPAGVTGPTKTPDGRR